jgi:hypothetical protein
VIVIDGATDDVLDTIDVGLSPLDFAWNPVQNRIYVANFDGSSISVLRDSAAGVEEDFRPQTTSHRPTPTVIRGVLFLPSSLLTPNCYLLSIDGRKVLELRPGANDVWALAPGVYFVRAVSGKLSAVGCHKVVLTR